MAWATATLLSMAIAASAVGTVRGGVTEIPEIPDAAPLAAAVTSILPATAGTTLPDSTPSTTGAATTASSVPSSTTTLASRATTTTTTSVARQTTTTATTAATTTTTAVGSDVSTHQLIGGQVTMSASNGEVHLVAAVPAGGFSAEIEDAGPAELKVEFESSDHHSTFRARWENGQLDIDIREEEED